MNFNYINRRLNNRKESTHESIRYSHCYVTPGCNGHNHPRKERVFARHVAQGNKTNMLYWRLHKEEYNHLKTQ